ncbi:hypothetical protein, partial [Maribacter sp. Asnod1-A12]|uniref:hypothetical protein n=1 Tax=Maribacter sp. Asnod1-A12 TaxID=3160576 RepID=UPI003866ECA9
MKSKLVNIKIRIILLFLVLFSISKISAQLDNTHYLPPVKEGVTGSGIQYQDIYFSTAVTTSFDVIVYRGTSTVPYATVTGLSATSPQRLSTFMSTDFPISGTPSSTINEITNISDANTGVILTNAGLRFESSTGDDFYANYRVRNNNQSDIMTLKGTKALGNEFRWGGITQGADSGGASTSLGIYATEDGTTVTISGYDTSMVFRSGTDNSAITDDIITIALDKGETFVLEAATSANALNNGWLGATILSNQPIAISNAQLVATALTGGGDDAMDQPVPVTYLGNDYIFVRGGSTNDNEEYAIIVATVDNTEVFAGGTSLGTINNGEYLFVSGSNYNGTTAGSNMYINTSQKAYAYQSTSGVTGGPRIAMNFIPPANCLLPSSNEGISFAADLAGANANGGVSYTALTIIASVDVTQTDLIITDNGVSIPIPAPISVTGNSNYHTYFIDEDFDNTSNLSITSTGGYPLAAGVFGRLGSISGFSGYFSGFDTVPEVNIAFSGPECYEVGGDPITYTAPSGYINYQWYRDGIEESGATSSSYNPTAPGAYTVRVEQAAGCYFYSDTRTFLNCIEAIDDNFIGVFASGETTTASIIDNDELAGNTPVIGTDVTITVDPNGTNTIGTIDPATGLINIDANTPDGTYTLEYQICEIIEPTNCSIATVTITVADADSDGVNDAKDLDDDNDGILDTEEENCDRLRFGLTADDTAPSGTVFTDSDTGISVTPTFTDTFGINNTNAVSDSDAFEVSNTYNNFDEYVTWDIDVSPTSEDLYLIFTDFDQNNAADIGETVTVSFYNGANEVNYYVSEIGANISQSENTFSAFQNGNNATTSPTGNTDALDNTLIITIPNQIDRIVVQVTITSYGAATPSSGNANTNFRIGSCFNDTDLDGTPNYLDLDSDNDGCFDVLESGGTDTDNDGILDGDGLNSDGQVTTGGSITDGYDGVTGNETVATEANVDATALTDQLIVTGGSTTFEITSATATSTETFTGTAPNTTPDYTTGETDVSSGLIYQWQENGVNLTDTGVYSNTSGSGATPPTLTISDVTGLDGNEYTLVVTHTDNICFENTNSATLNVDPDNDNDGIGDTTDLDDDNDGILDSDECFGPVEITPADFGLTNNTTGNTVSNQDLSANFGYPAGSIVITLTNTNVHSGGRWYTTSSAVPKFESTGTVDVSVRVVHGGVISGSGSNKYDGVKSLDGTSYTMITALDPTKYVEDNSVVNEFRVERITTSTENNNSAGGDFIWNSIGSASEFEVITTGGGQSQFDIFLESDCNIDTDGDGIPNSIDLDSDNDGIPDITEAGGTDTDGDGHIDYPTAGDPTSMVDTNDDGLADEIATTPLPDEDSDNDGIKDRLDLDSDNDGIPDVTEAGGPDTNGDGVIDTFATDTDNDGLADSVDPVGPATPGTPLENPDTDNDGLDDRIDLDSDNDGIPDITEAGGIDTDGDGHIDYPTAGDPTSMIDTNDDGLADEIATTPLPDEDSDNDGLKDRLDLDSDNDGIPDVTEAGGPDTNGDGVIDTFATDTDNDGLADSVDPVG